MFPVLAQLRPLEALHVSWRQSDPEIHLAIGSAGFGSWLAHVDWAVVISFVAFAVLTLGGVAIQLRKQWLVAAIEVDERRRRRAPSTNPRNVVPPTGYVADTRVSG